MKSIGTDRVSPVNIYHRDAWHIYGAWSILLESGWWVDMAAVVGVRPYDYSTAEAAGTGVGLVDVWFNDNDSDWDGLTIEQRDEALDILREAAAQLQEQIEEVCDSQQSRQGDKRWS